MKDSSTALILTLTGFLLGVFFLIAGFLLYTPESRRPKRRGPFLMCVGLVLLVAALTEAAHLLFALL